MVVFSNDLINNYLSNKIKSPLLVKKLENNGNFMCIIIRRTRDLSYFRKCSLELRTNPVFIGKIKRIFKNNTNELIKLEKLISYAIQKRWELLECKEDFTSSPTSLDNNDVIEQYINYLDNLSINENEKQELIELFKKSERYQRYLALIMLDDFSNELEKRGRELCMKDLKR